MIYQHSWVQLKVKHVSCNVRTCTMYICMLVPGGKRLLSLLEFGMPDVVFIAVTSQSDKGLDLPVQATCCSTADTTSILKEYE